MDQLDQSEFDDFWTGPDLDDHLEKPAEEYYLNIIIFKSFEVVILSFFYGLLVIYYRIYHIGALVFFNCFRYFNCFFNNLEYYNLTYHMD